MVARNTSVKSHLFEPSRRRVWTVVGPGSEHWVDPDMEVCSCRAFHFDVKKCAHIVAIKNDECETVKFSDEEFEGFIEGLLTDIWEQKAVK